VPEPVYLDFNATTPLDQRVAAVVRHYMEIEFGNAGSRTHGYGQSAAQAVEEARRTIADVAGVRPDGVIFTSGATEANNLAILGLGEHRPRCEGAPHVITTAVEHKAVLEPVAELARRYAFDTDIAPVDEAGQVDVAAIKDLLRPSTVLVSTMHANNETGTIQPVDEIADVLDGHPAYWHVDAAQTFGKLPGSSLPTRVDMISASGHKVFGPKGVGALLVRKRKFSRPPLVPLMVGGGQERGLRPGTAPVPLIAGFGTAVGLAETERESRVKACLDQRDLAEAALGPIGVVNGSTTQRLPHVLNVSIVGLDAEAAIMVLRDLAAVSNGSACTSSSYQPSHVLTAMGLDPARVESALRLSWGHQTPIVAWDLVASALALALR